MPPTVAVFVAAAPTSDNHAVTGWTTASEATVGSMPGTGVRASCEIQVATGAVTDTSHVVGPVSKPREAIPVAMSRRCSDRVVRRLVSCASPGIDAGRVMASLSSTVSVCVVVRVARSTEKPSDSSIPAMLVTTPASARLIAPTSTRRETVVSTARSVQSPTFIPAGMPALRISVVGLPLTDACP